MTPDDLMYEKALQLLQSEDTTVQELEWCRKFINDYLGRMGAAAVKGTVPESLKMSNFEGIKFDDLPVVTPTAPEKKEEDVWYGD